MSSRGPTDATVVKIFEGFRAGNAMSAIAARANTSVPVVRRIRNFVETKGHYGKHQFDGPIPPVKPGRSSATGEKRGTLSNAILVAVNEGTGDGLSLQEVITAVLKTVPLATRKSVDTLLRRFVHEGRIKCKQLAVPPAPDRSINRYLPGA